jgi:hypothetical protein
MTDEPRRIVLGTVESGANIIIVPRQALSRANQAFDAERKRRELEVERAKLRVVQQVSARSKLKRAMHAVFRRRGR